MNELTIRGVARGIAHRLRHGKPISVFGNMAPMLRALGGVEMERCGCGAIETTMQGERMESSHARSCPTLELRAALRRLSLPLAIVRRR